MWKNININIQNIERETATAVLIKMPNNSDYAGFKFWHPAKLVRAGKNSYAESISYTEDFKFKLFKNGNGKYNKFEKINEIEIGIDEFEAAFNVMNENITAPKQKDNYETKKPEIIEAKEVEIKEELKDE